MVVPEPKFVAELELVVSELRYNLSPEGVVAWDSGVSFEAVFAPMPGFVFEPSEADYRMVPSGDIHGGQSEALAGSTVVPPERLDTPVNVELEPLVEGTVGGRDASAGERSDFVALVCLSTAGTESGPVGKPGGKAEVVLQPVDAG